MLKTHNLAAVLLSGIAHIVPFDGKAGWKTTKVDDKDVIEMKDGNPVWVNADGTETTYGSDTITRLNGEAANNRKRYETAEAKLEAFKDIADPKAAIEALATVKDIKQGDLLAKGEVERVRKEISDSVKSELDSAKAEAVTARGEADSLRLETAFNGSKFIADKIAVPLDMVRSTFGDRFKVEAGKVYAVDANGQKLLSKAQHGEYASFDEAFEMIVEQYPAKDAILKGGNQQGSGNGGGGGANANNGQKTYRRAEVSAWGAKEPAKVAAAMAEVSAGTAQLID